eukprot:Awhi_evm1s3570
MDDAALADAENAFFMRSAASNTRFSIFNCRSVKVNKRAKLSTPFLHCFLFGQSFSSSKVEQEYGAAHLKSN